MRSGGIYNLKANAQSDDRPLSGDAIICSFGGRYHDYCSHIARTFFVNPVKEQTEVYKLLFDLQDHIVRSIRPGTALRDVWASAVEFVRKSRRSDLTEKMTKNCGWGIGINFLESSYRINAKSTKHFKEGMTFSICVGFRDVPLSDESQKKAKTIVGGKFACMIADTILVKSGGAAMLTNFKREFNDIHYTLEDSDDEDDDGAEEEEEELPRTRGGRATRSSTKSRAQLAEEKKAAQLEQKIAERQRTLMIKKAEEAQKKIAGADREEDEDDEEKNKLVKAFATTKNYPSDLVRNKIYCDFKSECVFLPIGGYHVPFHISTIKSATKKEEDTATFLRINFFIPTGSIPRDMPLVTRNLVLNFPHLAYVRELSFRSKDPRNLNHQHRLIKELQKRVRQREKQKADEKDLVEQAELQRLTDGRRVTLDGVTMKPALHSGRCQGRLRAHYNGLRFTSSQSKSLDIIYANVKHFIFQPCKKELTVLVHFHLKNPIMVGKHKTYNVQFYTEVVEGSQALDSRRRSAYDPDEVDEEHRERILKKRLNKMFEKFSMNVQDVAMSNNQPFPQVDIPYREMSFHGTPNKEMVLMQPTTGCLVNLTETPFFLVTLDDIEHVHFERVDPGGRTKNFDMVIVLKRQMARDSLEVPQRISAIPSQSLDVIQKWLDDKGDISFSSGTAPLNWKTVMKGVRDEIDRGIFWAAETEEGEAKDLGWNFLTMNEEEEESEGEESGSDFSIDEVSSGEEDSDEAFDSEEDFDEDEEDSDEYVDEEEDGQSWEELEKEAIKSDRMKRGLEARESHRDNARAKRRRR